MHADLKAMSGHKGLDVSEEAVKKIVPESLFMFLSLLTRGQSSLDEMLESDDTKDQEDECHDENEDDDADSIHFENHRKNYFDKKVREKS